MVQGAKLERTALRRNFDRAASTYDAASAVQREVARRMGKRLDYVKRAPARLLDLGCGTGADLVWLASRYPSAERIGCDLSLPMLERARGGTSWFTRLFPVSRPARSALLCADAVRLPFATNRFGMVWSNLALHWAEDPVAVFREVLRVLEVEGLFMFSLPGPDTLKELRRAFDAADAAPHVHGFVDMHDIGDMLVSAGFAEPVMEMELITVTYGDAADLVRELRHSGSGNASARRRRGLMGRNAWRTMLLSYEALRRDSRLPATLEVVYGHAWKPRPRASRDGRAIVRFERGRHGGAAT